MDASRNKLDIIKDVLNQKMGSNWKTVLILSLIVLLLIFALLIFV